MTTIAWDGEILAVEYAMTRDAFTGGEIVHWSLKTG